MALRFCKVQKSYAGCKEKTMPNLRYYECEDFIVRHALDQSLTPGTYKMHVHEDIEIYFFLRGKGYYIVEGTEYKLMPRDILIIRNAEAHMPRIDPGEPYERLVYNVQPAFLDKVDPSGTLHRMIYDHPLGQCNAFHADDYSENVWKNIEHFIQEQTADSHLLRLSAMGRLISILSELAYVYEKAKIPLPANDRLPSQIIRYVNEELFSELSLESISAHFFLSKSQLGKIFKAATGSSVWEYICIKRLIAAREMILSGYAAKDACISCGFKDYSAFWRAYKHKFNVSPSHDRTEAAAAQR